MAKKGKISVPTFLKWAGGKQKLLDQYEDYFPNKVKNYIEPFLGGGASFFYVIKYKKPESARGYDKNKDLINTYLQVRDNVNKLIKLLEELEEEHNSKENKQKYFYSKRTEFNHLKTIKRITKKKKTRKAALLIYLNKTCFNGLYRENSKGEFNVPFNKKKKAKIFKKEVIVEASDLLKNVDLDTKNFLDIKFNNDELAYFDPPYWSGFSKKCFTSYHKSDFDIRHQIKLAKLFKELHKKGSHKLILSNSDTELINVIYDHPEFFINRVNVRRMINCDGEKRNIINELLITSFPNNNSLKKFIK